MLFPPGFGASTVSRQNSPKEAPLVLSSTILSLSLLPFSLSFLPSLPFPPNPPCLYSFLSLSLNPPSPLSIMFRNALRQSSRAVTAASSTGRIASVSCVLSWCSLFPPRSIPCLHKPACYIHQPPTLPAIPATTTTAHDYPLSAMRLISSRFFYLNAS